MTRQAELRKFYKWFYSLPSGEAFYPHIEEIQEAVEVVEI